jgi:IS30 family transposase
LKSVFFKKEEKEHSFSFFPEWLQEAFILSRSPTLQVMRHLTLEQKYQIQILLNENHSVDQISQRLIVHRSTIYREIRRNSVDEIYQACEAEKKRKSRYKGQKKKIIGNVAKRVERLLKQEQWSPEQIAGKGKKDGCIPISHEAIYQYIFKDAANGGDLFTHLRWGRKKRQKRSSSHKYRGQIKNRVSIEHRPEAANTKAELGHLEGDTVVGKNKSGRILTIVDRRTMFMFAFLLKSGHAKITADAIIRILKKRKIPWKTLTVDNGKEFSDHTRITTNSKVPVYFCNPYASYERGLNENHNGLLRQYFPKNQSFEGLTQAKLDIVVNKINSRPRKTFGFVSPKKELAQIKKLERKANIVAILS